MPIPKATVATTICRSSRWNFSCTSARTSFSRPATAVRKWKIPPRVCRAAASARRLTMPAWKTTCAPSQRPLSPPQSADRRAGISPARRRARRFPGRHGKPSRISAANRALSTATAVRKWKIPPRVCRAAASARRHVGAHVVFQAGMVSRRADAAALQTRGGIFHFRTQRGGLPCRPGKRRARRRAGEIPARRSADCGGDSGLLMPRLCRRAAVSSTFERLLQ
jgi:hypothetical protein